MVHCLGGKMYKEDFDIIKAKSKTWTEGDWAIFFMWLKHFFSHHCQNCISTESFGSWCQSPSGSLRGKSEVSHRPVSLFFSSHSSKSSTNESGKDVKKKRNTFCVTSEPHLLVVITRAYVSGFLHPYNIIWFCTSIHVSHPRPSDALRQRQTWMAEGSSVHIYNLI